MMKKINQLISRVFLILAMLYPIFYPLTTNAKSGQTINDLIAELNSWKKQQSDNTAEKNLTQSEIKEAKQKIANAQAEQAQIEKEVEAAKVKIIESENKIAELTAETEALLRYFQLTQGDNIYSEYLSDATSLKDLIRRLAAVEQITEYSNATLEKLDALILENEQLQVELAEKEAKLDVMIANTEKELVSLHGHLDELGEVNVTIQDEINGLEQRIKYYKEICPDYDTPVTECTKFVSAAGWLRPLSQGFITSGWGGRTDPLDNVGYEYHNAVDIGGVAEGTNVYSSTPGIVSNIIYRSSCGGNQVFVLAIVNGERYTVQYAHLLSINVSYNQQVTPDTIIGKVGGGSTAKKNGGYDRCTTGTHLHYGVSRGFYTSIKEGGDYSTWSGFLANGMNPPGFPKRGVRWYTR